jgi:hypothetical protein
MRRLTYLIVFLILIFTYCKKEEIWPYGETWKGPQDYGYVQALRNGEAWEASASLHLRENKPNYCEIEFYSYFKSDSILAESLGLISVPIEKGTYNVHHTIGLGGTWVDSVSSLYVLLYDDVPRATYFPDSNKPNRLWIDAIDTLSGTISGRFDLFFKKDTADKVTKYPGSIHFESGVFKARFWP